MRNVMKALMFVAVPLAMSCITEPSFEGGIEGHASIGVLTITNRTTRPIWLFVNGDHPGEISDSFICDRAIDCGPSLPVGASWTYHYPSDRIVPDAEYATVVYWSISKHGDGRRRVEDTFESNIPLR